MIDLEFIDKEFLSVQEENDFCAQYCEDIKRYISEIHEMEGEIEVKTPKICLSISKEEFIRTMRLIRYDLRIKFKEQQREGYSLEILSLTYQATEGSPPLGQFTLKLKRTKI